MVIHPSPGPVCVQIRRFHDVGAPGAMLADPRGLKHDDEDRLTAPQQ